MGQANLIDQIKKCKYCTKVQISTAYNTIYCSRFLDDQKHLPVDEVICKLCGEYKKEQVGSHEK